MNPSKPKKNNPYRTIAVGLLAAVLVPTAWVAALRLQKPSAAQERAALLTQVPYNPTLQPIAASLSEKATLLAPTQVLSAAPTAERNAADIALPTLPKAGILQQQPFPSGIFDDDPGPFYSGDFKASNRWQGIYGGLFVQVFAGVAPNEPEQGLVIILTTDSDYHSQPAQWINAPKADGALRVVAQRDDVVEVVSTGGSTWLLDLAQGAWR